MGGAENKIPNLSFANDEETRFELCCYLRAFIFLFVQRFSAASATPFPPTSTR
jgi:hypothetical protein